MNDDSTKIEIELLCQVAAGSREAFSELYDRYARPLFALAMRMLKDAREAEDVLQDVFIQVWEKAPAFNPEFGRPFGWILTMTRNKALDRLRSARRRLELLTEEPASDGDEQKSAAEWNDEIVSREQSALVQTALAALPKDQREAIELAFFRGLTHDEIAAQLGEPLGTIKARIRRGMLKLRDSLEGQV